MWCSRRPAGGDRAFVFGPFGDERLSEETLLRVRGSSYLSEPPAALGLVRGEHVVEDAVDQLLLHLDALQSLSLARTDVVAVGLLLTELLCEGHFVVVCGNLVTFSK